MAILLGIYLATPFLFAILTYTHTQHAGHPPLFKNQERSIFRCNAKKKCQPIYSFMNSRTETAPVDLQKIQSQCMWKILFYATATNCRPNQNMIWLFDAIQRETLSQEILYQNSIRNRAGLVMNIELIWVAGNVESKRNESVMLYNQWKESILKNHCNP